MVWISKRLIFRTWAAATSKTKSPEWNSSKPRVTLIPEKIGITGGSYGGFMTLMAIGKTPDIWAAAVEEYGIINWLSMLKSSDPSLNEYLKALLGNPEKNRKVYEEDSPITYIRNEKAPLLVLQGDNDPRVPKEEAQQVVDILKKEGPRRGRSLLRE